MGLIHKKTAGLLMSSILERASEVFKVFAHLKGKKRSLAFVILGIFCLGLAFLGYGQSAREPINRKDLYESLKKQPKSRLKKMQTAGQKALAWIHLLEKGSLSLDKALRSPGQIPRRHVHFPKQDDVFDEISLSLYYYHAHRGMEKGHFHLFLMEEAIDTAKPLFTSSREDGFSHLIAISVDEKSRPFKLFTTNQWVTNENWYKAKDVIGFTEQFHIHGDKHDWATSQCLNALVTLFGPQIEYLILKRDEKIKELAYEKKIDQKAVLEDTQIELLSEMLIDIDLQLELLEKLV